MRHTITTANGIKFTYTMHDCHKCKHLEFLYDENHYECKLFGSQCPLGSAFESNNIKEPLVYEHEDEDCPF